MIIFLIKLYQKAISPFMPHVCRFYPSCSNYAIEAIQKKGVVRGVFKSAKRISRCHPFSKGGIDLVEVN